MPEGTPTPGAEGAEGGTEGGTPPEKTFTQADLDRVVEQRLARERSKYGDYDDLKTKASKLDEIEQANASDLEKATKRAETAETKAQAAEERAAAALRRAAVVAEATRAGAVDPDAVFALLTPDSVTVGDDGQVTGVEEAVKALLEAKSYLVGSGTAPPKAGSTGSAEGGPRSNGSGGKPDQLTRADLKTMTSEAIVEAKAKGQLDDLLGA